MGVLITTFAEGDDGEPSFADFLGVPQRAPPEQLFRGFFLSQGKLVASRRGGLDTSVSFAIYNAHMLASFQEMFGCRQVVHFLMVTSPNARFRSGSLDFLWKPLNVVVPMAMFWPVLAKTETGL